jgi:hypothetical protein
MNSTEIRAVSLRSAPQAQPQFSALLSSSESIEQFPAQPNLRKGSKSAAGSLSRQANCHEKVFFGSLMLARPVKSISLRSKLPLRNFQCGPKSVVECCYRLASSRGTINPPFSPGLLLRRRAGFQPRRKGALTPDSSFPR